MRRGKAQFGPRVTNAGFGLEQEADALLRAAGGFGRKEGVYREEDLDRKVHQHEALVGLPESARAIGFLDVLQWREFSHAMDRAGLTDEEMACVGQWKKGVSQRETARLTRLNVYQVRKHLASGRWKVYRQLPKDTSWGWLDALIEDIERHIRNANWVRGWVD